MKRLLRLATVTLLSVIIHKVSLGQDTKMEEIKPQADRHEFITRGNHAKEIASGNYVVVGGFRTEDTARHYVDELKKIDFSEAAYGYLTHRNIWYIHFGTSADIDAARTSRDEYRKLKMFKDAWLLTVHE